LHARRLAARVGVPSVPGTLEPASVDDQEQVAGIIDTARRIGFPLLVKAAAGGGGRGMRRVTREEDLAAALVSGSREAESAFGDGSVYLEREIVPARHIEVQLLGDAHGRVVALGERAATPSSHAIEVRISAEDPSRAFAPTPGRVGRWVMPSGPGIRVDTHIEAGDRVPADYDNLIAKLMVHAHDRDAAIDRLRRALDEVEIGGVQTTVPFHREVARSDSFRRADLSTGWVDTNWDGEAARREAVRKGLLAAGLAALDEAPAAGQTLASAMDSVPDRRDGHGASGDGWRRGSRVQGIDRWPS